MTNPQYAARKKANRNAVRRTVKTGFKAMFPRQDLATQITGCAAGVPDPTDGTYAGEFPRPAHV